MIKVYKISIPKVKGDYTMKEFNSFTDFRLNMELIPKVVALDVMVRINDWLQSGGSLEDEYVKSNLKFASKFINYKGE